MVVLATQQKEDSVEADSCQTPLEISRPERLPPCLWRGGFLNGFNYNEDKKEIEMIDIMEIEAETRRRWDSGTFLERGTMSVKLDLIEIFSFDTTKFPWVPYEKYMMAQLIEATPGRVGFLRIKFPSNVAEDSKMHIHPYSDRVVTTLEGSGRFVAVRPDRSTIEHELNIYDRIWMPRGIPHTFFAGSNGLVVESIHNPFFAFDDPRCLVYPSDVKGGKE